MNLAARAKRISKKLGLRQPGNDRNPTAWRPDLPEPHAAQKEVLASARRFNIVNCGRRWGKTTIGSHLVVEPALQGYPAAWFAPDYKALVEVWRELCRHLRPVTVKRDAQQFRLELATGGVIDFWSLDSDPEACRGRRYKRVVLDEAAKARHLQLAWEAAIRATLVDFEGDAWFFSTPRGRDYYWELWWRGWPENEDRESDKNREFASFQMPSWTNPHIPPTEIDAMRRDLPKSTFSQEIEAQFLEVGGRFFDEWNPEAHVGVPFEIPEHYRFIGGMDYGTHAPTAFLLGTIDENNRLIVVDEVYVSGLVASEQAKLVRECILRHTRNLKDVLVATDPAIFPPGNPKDRVGQYEVEEFWKVGIECVPAVNKRVSGWNRLRQMMHDNTLLVFRTCPNLIRTIPLMVRDEKNPEDMESEKVDDHCCDSLRYMAQIHTEASQAKIERHRQRFALITEESFRKTRSDDKV